MENNPSQKKIRGFKYMILVLLIFAAFGLAWFSAGGSKSGENLDTMKEKASSLAADAKSQGKSLMEKAGDVKEGIGDTIAEGRDKVSSMASDVGDKTGEMVQAASEAGSDMVERVQSATDSGKDWIEGAKSAIGSDEMTDMENTEPSDDMSEQATNTLNEGQSRVKSMMEDSSGTMPETPSMALKDQPSLSFNKTPSGTMPGASEAEEMKGSMDRQMSADADKVSDTFKEGMPEKAGETHMAGMDTSKSGMSDKSMSDVSSDTASAKVADTSGEAMAQKGDASGSTIRCIGTPPEGKDQGDHYIVAMCETMSIISERTGVEMNDLKTRNPQVENPDLIFPNQRLWLPPRG